MEDFQNNFTVTELRNICRKNNLPVAGLKIDLVKRVLRHFAEINSQISDAEADEATSTTTQTKHLTRFPTINSIVKKIIPNGIKPTESTRESSVLKDIIVGKPSETTSESSLLKDNIEGKSTESICESTVLKANIAGKSSETTGETSVLKDNIVGTKSTQITSETTVLNRCIEGTNSLQTTCDSNVLKSYIVRVNLHINSMKQHFKSAFQTITSIFSMIGGSYALVQLFWRFFGEENVEIPINRSWFC